MLNYIWLSLIVLGIAVAVYHDVDDLRNDPYRNNLDLPLVLQIQKDSITALDTRQSYLGSVTFKVKDIAEFYGESHERQYPNTSETLPITFKLIDGNTARLSIDADKSEVQTWVKMAGLQSAGGHTLQGTVRIADASGQSVSVQFRSDPIRFVTINKVTNEGIVRYAKTAVELAIGLIGIMALWLGVMRIAEQAGLIAKLAALLKPVTTRLFPDVPADHPAMGAIIMNISANVLGLANAATPLGLKAMEELNKLNRKLGTATDAMCTFLVINTSNVQLIPATVIAIRAAAGSGDPTGIIGPAIVATAVSTIVGVATVKLLGRLRLYRKQIEETEKL
jgi:spore maturation protein A